MSVTQDGTGPKPSLAVVLGTYNRLELLQQCVTSIIKETNCNYHIYITDAGSTDGTVDFLSALNSPRITVFLIGERLGQARAYNDVFALVSEDYTAWLSDDNQVVNGGLDTAMEILCSHPDIGMVGLKTKDIVGPFTKAPYIGGISPTGILNVNQGVLPTSLLRAIGGFCEEFRDYGIDPALTAEVLLRGFKVVYTKQIALHHARSWSEDPSSSQYQWLKARHKAAADLYTARYGGTGETSSSYRLRLKLVRWLKKLALHAGLATTLMQRAIVRDLLNIVGGRYISMLDPINCAGEKFHLVQKARASCKTQQD